MAENTSEFSSKILCRSLLISIHLIICQLSLSICISTQYVYTPSDILDITEHSCFVGISVHSKENIKTIIDNIVVAFNEESNVKIGFIEHEQFEWPSGNFLKLEHDQTLPIDILTFSKRNKDRTCLLTGNLVVVPEVYVYSGAINTNVIVEFINSKCLTLRKTNGQLQTEGLHRQEILQSLFHVRNISDKNIGQLSENHGLNDKCVDDSCLDKKNHVKHKETRKYMKVLENNQNIKTCEKISMPSKYDFFHNYLKISKPVIITGAINHWPAIKKWTNQYFREQYGNHSVHIKLTPTGEFEGVTFAEQFQNYKTFKIPHNVKKQLRFPDLVVVRPATENMKFSQFIDLLESVANKSRTGMSAYLEYSSLADIAAELEEDISEMSFFNNMLQLKHQNIWLSDGNTLGKLHFDPFDNFLCQISGRKRVTMFDPHHNEDLYEAHIPEAMLGYNDTTHTFTKATLMDSTSMVMSPVDIQQPDFQRFPDFAEVHPYDCTIDEGDVLFMPAFWWHEVQSYPNVKEQRNLAVNFWYDPFLKKEFPCAECRLDVNPNYHHLL